MARTVRKRTKFFGVTPATQAQFKRIEQVLNSIHPSRRHMQYVEFESFNEHTGRMVLCTFFLSLGADRQWFWKGYKFIVFRDGDMMSDKEFEVVRIDGIRTLVRPASFDVEVAI